jgi:hypothetical protein
MSSSSQNQNLRWALYSHDTYWVWQQRKLRGWPGAREQRGNRIASWYVGSANLTVFEVLKAHEDFPVIAPEVLDSWTALYPMPGHSRTATFT